MTAEPTTSAPSYRERLHTPWWWYLGAIAVAVLLGAEFAFAVSGWITWVPLLVLVPVCILVVIRLSAARVSVIDGRLEVPGADVPVGAITRAIALSPFELRRLVGRHSDPTAFVFIRSWVGPGVQLILDETQTWSAALGNQADEESDRLVLPTPYWVISTRHPERLLNALQAPVH